MLNPFPIQFLALLAYAILRIIVAAILLYLGFSHIQHREVLKEQFSQFRFGLVLVWYLGTLEIIVGMMFMFGFYTQIAALLSMLMAIKFMILKGRLASPLIPGRLFYLLLFGVSLSLFITGAGIFAFDLPI